MHSKLKFIFLEIQNKAIRPFLSGPVTYVVVLQSLMLTVEPACTLWTPRNQLKASRLSRYPDFSGHYISVYDKVPSELRMRNVLIFKYLHQQIPL